MYFIIILKDNKWTSYTNEIFETEAKANDYIKRSSQEKTSIKQSNITKRISTNIGTNKQNLEELKKQTLLNILSAKGVIYTYYKNNQLMRKQ